MDNWLINNDEQMWKWNWTELCGYHGGIKPLNTNTHDLDVCFQQLCLQVIQYQKIYIYIYEYLLLCFLNIFQIPVLTCIAIISAYHCGKRNVYSIRHYGSNYFINLRIIITICLVILPILRAYIIVTNTVLDPSRNNSIQKYVMSSTKKPELLSMNSSNILHQIQDEWNHTIDIAKSIFFPKNSIQNTTQSSVITTTQEYNPIFTTVKNKVTSAKPIDYLVAGTEGLAWVVHLCFILSLKKGRDFNPRGPVSIRALILLLIVISALLLRSHIKYNPQNDVLPNLSLGFSIIVVTLLILYALTLIPGHNNLRDMRSSQYNEVSHKMYITLVHNIISN